eukprot:8828085-Alexandrium_andersonii.AAC.1
MAGARFDCDHDRAAHDCACAARSACPAQLRASCPFPGAADAWMLRASWMQRTARPSLLADVAA